MKRVWKFAAAGCLCVLAAGCGSGGGPSALQPIIIDGSSTVFRISQAAHLAYRKVAPEVVVVVDYHGTGGGFSRYGDGEVDIVDASREAKADEEARANAEGMPWTRFLVGYDGITLVVNPRNTWAKALTVAQLKALWEPGSKITKWRDLDPAWPDQAIVLYSPDNNSGTFEFFTQEIVGHAGNQRDDVQQSSDDNTLVSGVAGDVGALGYFGYAYFASNKDKLRALAVQNGPGAQPVAPSAESIRDKSYAPLSRPLFIYVKNSAARRPEAAKFLAFYLEKIDELAKTGGYDPPTEADRASNARLLAGLQGKAAAPAKAEPNLTKKG